MAGETGLSHLNDALLNCSYLVSDRLTIADLAVFDKLSSTYTVYSLILHKNLLIINLFCCLCRAAGSSFKIPECQQILQVH